mmetsp:Transcript_22791/g.25384  ORF Transcript_22791/g.25384 Transcript_22791/m.25384 type:complete len:210 (+) Transcript_22791:44-673(+)
MSRSKEHDDRNEIGRKEFDRWKEKFSSTIQQIEKSLTESNDATKLIRKAYSILSNKMASEIKKFSDSNNHQQAIKQDLVDIYSACNMQIDTYKILNEQKEILFQNEIASTNETVTLSRSSITPSSYDNNIRDNVNANTQGRVRKQNSQLQDALKSISESEQVAKEITNDLYRQRESLETTQGRLQQFSSVTEQAKGLLKSMNKPWWQKW